MAGFYFDGKVYEVPQAVSKIDVILNIGAPLPDFGIGLIIGRNYSGPGYDQTDIDPVAGFTKLSNVGAFYGDDSELATAFKYWSLHGGGTVFCMGTSATTKTILKWESGDNKFMLTSKEFGTHTADYNIDLNVSPDGSPDQINYLKITPLKLKRFLLKDASSGSYTILVRDTGTLKAGSKVNISASVDGGADKLQKNLTIKTIETVGPSKMITFEEVLTDDFDYDQSAHIFQLDATKEESFESITSMADLKAAVNATSVLFTADIENEPGVTLLDDIDNKIIREIKGTVGDREVTTGVSPVSGSGSWTTSGILENLSDHIKRNRIRLINPIVTDGDVNIFSPTSTEGYYKTALDNIRAAISQDIKPEIVSQRTNFKPVQVFVGAMNGVINMSSDTTYDTSYDPVEWAGDMNNQDIILAVGGLDGIAPAATFAPAVMAMVSSGPIAHNLTRDPVAASDIEREWRFPGTNINKLIDNGCIVILSRSNGYFVTKGINTLLDNTTSWNLNSTTYLPMQRAMGDFVDITLREGVDNTFIGSDGVTTGQITNFVVKTLDSIQAISPTIIREYKVESVVPSQNQGFLVDYSVRFSEETNFVGLTMEVLVG